MMKLLVFLIFILNTYFVKICFGSHQDHKSLFWRQQRQQIVCRRCSLAFDGEFGRSLSSSKKNDDKSILAFAGGFGASSSKKKKNKKSKQNKLGRVTSEFLELDPNKKRSSSTKDENDEQPQLDRWGLPILTEDELFPKMPPGTELIPVSNNINKDSLLDDIKDAMKNYIQLNYDRFDKTGVEKKSSGTGISEAPMKLNLLHKSPPVLSIDNFFTEDECKQIQDIVLIEDESSSLQINSATFSPLSLSKRTSTTWFVYYKQMASLLAKASYLLDKPLEHMEEPQIVRYKTGEEFTWHYDEVPKGEALDNGGQRVGTLLVYLNTVQSGGGTIFRDLGDQVGNTLTMKPKIGSALLFFPSNKNGVPDDRTLHKGEIAKDEKWIAQMWIHERTYKPVVPEGNTHEDAIPFIKQMNEKLGYL